MDLIYQNFDGLDVTFQGIVPEYILDALENGRQEAERSRNPVLIKLGKDQIPVHVAETGMRGGYVWRATSNCTKLDSTAGGNWSASCSD